MYGVGNRTVKVDYEKNAIPIMFDGDDEIEPKTFEFPLQYTHPVCTVTRYEIYSKKAQRHSHSIWMNCCKI